MSDTADNSCFDVLVAGAGTAGVPAAIQAARAGASVLLVEKNGMPGGTITVAGVPFPGIFHAWGRQVIAGIGWDLVRRTVEECGGRLQDFSSPPERHWMHQVRVSGPIFAALCDEELAGAGVQPQYHTMVAAVHGEEDGWRVTLCTKTGLRDVRARVLIDCTGDANLAALAGCELRIPDTTQPGTVACRALGYDVGQLAKDDLDAAALAAFERGELEATDAGWDRSRPHAASWLAQRGGNANHIHGQDARTSAGKTQLEIAARASILRLFRFLRRQPGLDGLQIDRLSPECGVRETATIVGRETITARDYVNGKLWPDAVCHAFYPIDLHTSDGGGLDCRQLKPGIVPSVPRGALLPRGVDDLLVAGRCLSSDRLANSALRVQATCMATGQVAGALAAQAVQRNEEPGEVPLCELRVLLEAHGAVVPGGASLASTGVGGSA